MLNAEPMALPKHIGFIMDGNRRWARATKNDLVTAYRKGGDVLELMVEQAKKWEVKFVTFFTFSEENWNRPKNEVEILMNLFEHYLQEKVKILHEKNVRFKVIGRLYKFSAQIQKKVLDLVELTKNNTAITLVLALSYGGKAEIIDAINKIIKNPPEEVTEQNLQNYLYDHSLLPVDLIIRTSGEERTSGFMLWEADYAELFFLKKNWPELTAQDLDEAVKDFGQRKRNFGT